MKASTVMFAAAGLIVVGLVGFAVSQNSSGPSPYDKVAQCLTDKGVKMYGAWWCPHCENQKEMFGSAFDKIDYVECSPGQSRGMSQHCKNEGIEGFPTWRFPNGEDLRGEQPIEKLAERVGCEAELPDQTNE